MTGYLLNEPYSGSVYAYGSTDLEWTSGQSAGDFWMWYPPNKETKQLKVRDNAKQRRFHRTLKSITLIT